MKASLWGWLILIAGSGIFFFQVIRLAMESFQPLWKAALLFLSVVESLW